MREGNQAWLGLGF